MCGALIISAGKHTWENGICTVCEYECRHTGGKATCTQKAVCYLSCSCGVAGSETFEYGETSAHTYKDDWSTDTSCHWRECSACGEKKDSEEHEPYEHGCNICYKILSICAEENNDNRCAI